MIQPVSTLQQVTLRSTTLNDLFVPRARLRFGERAFSIAFYRTVYRPKLETLLS